MSHHQKQADMSLEKRRLRMWIRMFRTTKSVELKLRDFLRVEHGTTLPRFDVLAALYRAEEGLKMSALSRQLLVSNGNVTGIVDRLVSDGLVKRVMTENDRRSTVVFLTPLGRETFSGMAEQHATLINDLFFEVDEKDLNAMADIFGRLKEREDDYDQDG